MAQTLSPANGSPGYGDGTSDTLTAPPFSHQYAQAGNFNTQLTVLTISVVRIASSGTVPFLFPNPRYCLATDSLSCEGKPVQFLSCSGNTYLAMEFGDALLLQQ